MGTSVPAVKANLAAALRLRPALTGVGVHVIMLDAWTDSEAICFTGATAPQSWVTMTDPGTDENATLSGIVFVELAGASDAAAVTAEARCGVLLDELVDQLNDDPDVGGAITASIGPPLLTQATWSTWPADEEGVAVARVRVDWVVSWAAPT